MSTRLTIKRAYRSLQTLLSVGSFFPTKRVVSTDKDDILDMNRRIDLAVPTLHHFMPPILRRTASIVAITLMISACVTAHVDASSEISPGESVVGNYLAGRKAQADGNMAAAATFFGAALESDPDEASLIRRTFLVYLSDGRITEANALAKRVLEDFPTDIYAAYTRAAVMLHDGRIEEARDLLLNLKAEGLNRFVVPLLMAWSHMDTQDSDQALKMLSPLAASEGTQMLHNAHAALITGSSGRYGESEQFFGSLLESQGDMTIRTTELYGALYEKMGSFDKAIALYDGYTSEHGPTRFMEAARARAESGQASDSLPFDVRKGAAEAMFDMASSLRQQNSFESALLMGRLGLFLRPDFPSLQLMVGTSLERLGRHLDANEVYQTIDPEIPFAWNANLRIAGNLARLGHTDDAIAKLEKIAANAPNKADPLIELGDVYRDASRFEEAARAYDRAFDRLGDLSHRHWGLLYARGIALERSGRWEDAENDFLKALEFEPDQPYVLNYLGYTWVEKGLHLDRARKMIEKAVELRPNDGYIVDSLGWVYYQLGEFESAVKELERAVELLPEDPVINDHLGDAYWQVGRNREARFQWRRSLSLSPEDKYIPLIESKIENGLVNDGTDDNNG